MVLGQKSDSVEKSQRHKVKSMKIEFEQREQNHHRGNHQHNQIWNERELFYIRSDQNGEQSITERNDGTQSTLEHYLQTIFVTFLFCFFIAFLIVNFINLRNQFSFFFLFFTFFFLFVQKFVFDISEQTDCTWFR